MISNNIKTEIEMERMRELKKKDGMCRLRLLSPATVPSVISISGYRFIIYTSRIKFVSTSKFFKSAFEKAYVFAMSMK